jgi:hypothetical protein
MEGSDMMRLAGRWRIVAMELWNTDAIELVGPGFLEFDRDRLGRLGFIAVEGQLDWREVVRDGHPGVEFSWEGDDDGDPVTGRGWAVLTGEDTLDGRIFFHRGDDSGFRVVRDRPARKTADPVRRAGRGRR